MKCSSQFFNHVDNRWRVKEKNDSKSSCISLKPNYLWLTRYSKQYHTIWEKSPCYPLKSTINHCWPLKQQLINSFWNTSKDTRHERDFVHFFHAKLIRSNIWSDDSNSAAQKAKKHCSNDRRRLEINDLVHCLFWSRQYKVSFCGGAALFQMLDLNEQVLLNIINLSIRSLHDFIVNLSSLQIYQTFTSDFLWCFVAVKCGRPLGWSVTHSTLVIYKYSYKIPKIEYYCLKGHTPWIISPYSWSIMNLKNIN